MTRWIAIAAIVVGAAIAIVMWSRTDDTNTDTDAHSARSGSSAGENPPDTTDRPTRDHELEELDVVTKLAKTAGLGAAELVVVVEAQKELQLGRRVVFDDLAARRINAEGVSSRLHELRRQMTLRIEAGLDPVQAKRILDAIRDAHR